MLPASASPFFVALANIRSNAGSVGYVVDAASIRSNVVCGVGYFPPIIPLPTLSLCDFATFLYSIDHAFQCRHLSDSASLND